MKLRRDARLGKAAAALSVITGTLLVFGAVTNGLFAGPTISGFASGSLWSVLVFMLPIPGGTVAPEIDAGSIGTTIALLTGGILLLGGLDRMRQPRSETPRPVAPQD
jgi:hypothetical protein